MLSCLWQIVGPVLPLLTLFSSGDCRGFNLTFNQAERIDIPCNETLSLYVHHVPAETVFAVIQLHTQRYNLSLSSKSTFNKGYTKNGRDVGLVTMLDIGGTFFDWYVQAPENLTAVAYVQLYTQDDPIPGGCNQVFSLPMDGSIEVNVGAHSTIIWFQWSNLACPQGQTLPNCESKNVTNNLMYDVYVLFIEQRDFSEDSYLRNIEQMLNPDSIAENGFNVFTVIDNSNSKSLVTVTSETNQGALYAVVVTRSDNSRRAAYITAVTYACDIYKNTCSSKCSALEIVFTAVFGCCGLFLLVVGHSYLKIMFFLFGLIFTSLLVYILLSINQNLDFTMKLPVSIAGGAGGGLIWVLYWYCCAFPVISVLVPGLCAGYLVASVMFFTPFGNLWWWTTTVNYAIGFSCVVLVFAVFLMGYQKVLSIISCGIVGAFMFLMSLAIPLRSSLRQIFLNSIYHQTEEGYATVKVVAPLSTQDIALMTLWPVFTIAGCAFQFYRNKNKPPFQIPARHRRTQAQEQVPQRFTRSDEENDNDDDERANLLPKETHVNIRRTGSYQSIPAVISRAESSHYYRNSLT